MATQSKAQKVKLINEMYSDLHYAIEPYGSGYGNLIDKAYRMEVDAEKAHRRFAPDGRRIGISVAVAAKLFVCEHVLQAWLDPKPEIGVDLILDYREAVLYCWAIAHRYSGAISKALSHSKASENAENRAREWLAAIDYVELVNS